MLRALRWERKNALGTLAGAWMGKLMRPALVGGAMFLLMRAEWIHGLSPLAVAFFAAGLAAGESAIGLAAGCLLGALRFPLEEISLAPLIGCAAVLGGEIACTLIPRIERMATETRASILSGFSLLIPGLLFAGGEALPSLQATGAAALGASAAPFLFALLGVTFKRKQLLTQEKLGAALMFTAGLSGLQSVLPSVAFGAMGIAILLTPELGAAMGALAGLGLWLGGANPLVMASGACLALIANLKFFRDRWQNALAFACMTVIAYLTLGHEAAQIVPGVAASILFLLLPNAPVNKLRELFSPVRDDACDPDRIARAVSAESEKKLRALGDAFGDMAEGFLESDDVPDEQGLICDMRQRLCEGCSNYEACWAGADNRAVRLLCQLISEALERVDAPPGMRILFSDGEIPPDVLRVCRRGRMIPDRLGLMLRDFAEKRRAEIKRCANDQILSVQFMQAREILYSLADRQSRPIRFHGQKLERVRAALDRAGLGECELTAFGLEGAEIILRRDGEGWTRNEVARACSALSGSLGGGFVPKWIGDALKLSQQPRLALETGVACQSGIAGAPSGDNHLIRALDHSRMAVMLSDGMGSGDGACAESGETLRLLWRFLDADISRALALETVNRQMLSLSGEDMFATVDLLIVDLNTGVAEFSKLAACRTLIVRDGEVLRVEGGHLPLGILERVQPAVQRVRLRPDDLIIMGSDGVMEANDPLKLERLVRMCARMPANQLAERLVHEAALAREQDRMDDMTCICVRLEKTERERQNAREPCRSAEAAT